LWCPLSPSDTCHTLSCVLVFDASTLILLAKSELLDIFLDDYEGTPVIPGAVAVESSASSRPDALLIRQRIAEGRLKVEEVQPSGILGRLNLDFRLGAGEAAALALALETGESAVVATDDRSAIRACKVLRISFVTSLGILSRAVERGLLTPDAGMRYLERLRAYGRFRDEVIEEVSRLIGESRHGKSPENG
jgi:predicted nucleic acid-binding protein